MNVKFLFIKEKKISRVFNRYLPCVACLTICFYNCYPKTIKGRIFSLEALERQYFIKKGSVFNSKTIHVSGKEIKHNMASLKLKEIILQGQVECVDHLYLTLNIEGIRTPYFVDLTELVFSDLKEVSVGQSIYILGRLAESVENKSYLIAKELNLNKS